MDEDKIKTEQNEKIQVYKFFSDFSDLHFIIIDFHNAKH